MIYKKEIIIFCSSIFMSASLMSFESQPSASFEIDNDGDTIKTMSFNPNLEAYFGGCGVNANGGLMNKEQFLNNLKNNLCAKDLKTNNEVPIVSFDFTYSERAVSEDDLGLPILTTDVSFEEFAGNAIPTNWKAILTEKLYKGDTVKFTNIKVRTSKGKERAKNAIIIPITQ